MNAASDMPPRQSLLAEGPVGWKNLERVLPESEWPEPWSLSRGATRWLPPAELVETEDNLFLTVELPGVEATDLDISVQDRTVVVKGEKRGLNQGGVAVRFSELDYGPFERKVQLPNAARYLPGSRTAVGS